MPFAPRLLVGTSGWSYDDWVGPFYPVALRHHPEEWLAFYATRFRTVEINSTYYAFPGEALVRAWCRKGVALLEQGRFEFSLKMPRDVTHRALVDGRVDDAREITGRFDREVLDPLDGEGLLGAVLLQLSPFLKCSAESVDAIAAVLEPLAERRVAIEFRHSSWAAGGQVAPEARRLFHNEDICLAQLDGPSMPDVEPPPSRHAYVRFHGRRHDRWFGARDDDPVYDGARYDYLYAPEELEPWARRVEALAERHREVRVYFNNHVLGKGAANALDLMHMLGMATDVPRPKLTEQKRLF
jgi:uncharacterized protein YecE (DUF72 family)